MGSFESAEQLKSITCSLLMDGQTLLMWLYGEDLAGCQQLWVRCWKSFTVCEAGTCD